MARNAELGDGRGAGGGVGRPTLGEEALRRRVLRQGQRQTLLLLPSLLSRTPDAAVGARALQPVRVPPAPPLLPHLRIRCRFPLVESFLFLRYLLDPLLPCDAQFCTFIYLFFMEFRLCTI